jgi:DNA-directed RNA polymerase specialized sigma24 family protein
VTGENRTLKQLRGVAAKLSSDFELQKDLLQEMFIHLVRVQVDLPGRTPSWYIKSCEFHARNYLKHGRSVDSHKRARNVVPLGQVSDDAGGKVLFLLDPVDPLDLHSELVTQDIVDLIMPQLTDTQQRIFFFLIRGLGVREIARELRITHPAVIKHRKKIARVAIELLQETSWDDLNSSSNGKSRAHAFS